MRHDDYGHHHWKAEDMAAFLRDKTGINIEKIDRPSFMRSGWFPVVFLAAVLTLGAVAYNLYYAEFMKNLVLWTMGVLFVYWFSVSGGMHNIIRGVPLYYPDQEGKIKVSLYLCDVTTLHIQDALCTGTISDVSKWLQTVWSELEGKFGLHSYERSLHCRCFCHRIKGSLELKALSWASCICSLDCPWLRSHLRFRSLQNPATGERRPMCASCLLGLSSSRLLTITPGKLVSCHSFILSSPVLACFVLSSNVDC